MGTCTMIKMPWMMYLWPGLPQIWKRGTWLGLAMAVGFAVLVNLSLMTSLIWSELTSPGMRIISWVLVGLIWLASAAASYGWERTSYGCGQDSSRQQGQEAPLAEGLQYYLQKNWFEAERVFRQLLRRNSRDTDAGLMLATLLRHTERFEEAKIQLQRLGRIDGSEKWDLEIRQEQRMLDKAKSQREESDETIPVETVLNEKGPEEEPKTQQGTEEPSVDDRQAA